MAHRFILIPPFFFALACLSTSGCQPEIAPNEGVQAEKVCAPTDVSTRCVIESANAVLNTIDGNIEWASSAAELAIAYDVFGQHEKAAALIDAAIGKAQSIEDHKKQGGVLVEILAAITGLKPNPKAQNWLESIQGQTADIPATLRYNIMAKIASAEAAQGDLKLALAKGISLPQGDDYSDNYKAVALRKIANIAAKQGDFASAQTAIETLTMSIPYYQAMVRSDVARYAYKMGKPGLAETLLSEGEAIAREQDNGYFKGAALRDIGYSLVVMGKSEKAQSYFEDAQRATATAKTPNERARATSRIATRLADAGLSDKSLPILERAVSMAQEIEAEGTKGYTYYEIAGAASFSAEFDFAKTLMADIPDTPLGSTSSLKSAAERDLVWGLARAGNLEQALGVANNISSPRERVHALSRLARLRVDPDMKALPRYL